MKQHRHFPSPLTETDQFRASNEPSSHPFNMGPPAAHERDALAVSLVLLVLQTIAIEGGMARLEWSVMAMPVISQNLGGGGVCHSGLPRSHEY